MAEREVNVIREEEVLQADVSELEDDKEDEIVVPAQEEEAPEVPETPEKPASDSSPEEEEAPVQPKPVEGETQVERARRFEIQRLRAELRKKDRDELTKNAKPPKKNEDIYAELRTKYTDDEIKNSEELVDAIARAKGFVKKEEAYQDTANQVLEGFLDANPEYKPENDADDVRWNSFQRVLSSDYNLQHKTASQLLTIYKKVDRDVKEMLGEPVRKQDSRKIETQKQKIQSVSHSGGSKPTGKKELEVEPSVRQHFKGFTDDDF